MHNTTFWWERLGISQLNSNQIIFIPLTSTSLIIAKLNVSIPQGVFKVQVLLATKLLKSIKYKQDKSDKQWKKDKTKANKSGEKH